MFQPSRDFWPLRPSIDWEGARPRMLSSAYFPPWGGVALNSMINFLQVQLLGKASGTFHLERLQWIEIKSLENFSCFCPRWSWSASASLQATPNHPVGHLLPQVEIKGGISHAWKYWRFFWPIGPQLHPDGISPPTQFGPAGLTFIFFAMITCQQL